jgi:hypothetical protein
MDQTGKTEEFLGSLRERGVDALQRDHQVQPEGDLRLVESGFLDRAFNGDDAPESRRERATAASRVAMACGRTRRSWD